MGEFVPYNLQLVKAREDTPSEMEFFISAMLETPMDNKDQLVDVVVQDIAFEPSVAPFKQMNLAVTVNIEN